jgi:hypothetical protein
MSVNSNSEVKSMRFSAINARQQCPLWAWLVYRQKISGYKNPYAKLGIAIHDLLAEYAEHCVNNSLSTDHDFLDKKKYNHFVNIEQDQFDDANQMVESIKNHYNWECHFNHSVLEIEKRYMLDKNFNPTENEDEAYISGGIDFLYIDADEAVVMDYKTVRSIYTKSFMKDSLQRKIYSLLALKHYSQIEQVSFVFDFVRYGYESTPITMGREEIEGVETLLRAEIEATQEVLAQQESPVPSPGAHCILCEGRASCPAYRQAFDLRQQITTPDEAAKLYRQWRLGKVRMDASEELLKFWINTHGPIQVNGEEYGLHPENTTKYNDTKKMIDILTTAGVPMGAIHDALSITSTNVKNIIKRFKLSKEVQKSIEAIAIVTTSTKYKAKKIKGVEDEDNFDEDEELETRYL